MQHFASYQEALDYAKALGLAVDQYIVYQYEKQYCLIIL